MLPRKNKSELISIINPIEGIYTLEFNSLNGKYKYHPGQFLHLALDTDFDGSGQWPESRCFSMQSNPEEPTIKITYSVKGQFTTEMEEHLTKGSLVWLKLPYGDLFTQPHNKVNTTFIAGGTGITPFLSLFTHESFKEYTSPRIILGFRSKAYNIYENELALAKFRNAKIYYQDVDGQIDIQDVLSNSCENSDYFISGPPAMIKSLKESLIKNGISAEHILTDDWR